MTGAGLTDALAGASVLVDVTNAPSSGAGSVMSFFTASATNLVEAARRSGVGHYVVLSIVGVDGLPDNDYFQAKVAQERIVAESAIPYSIVRATQFVEFTNQITASLTDGDVVRVPDALIQPIPADEVAAEIARVAVSEPLNGIVDIGGAAKITCEQMARDALARSGDTSKTVVVDPTARYFGATLRPRSLVTAD